MKTFSKNLSQKVVHEYIRQLHKTSHSFTKLLNITRRYLDILFSVIINLKFPEQVTINKVVDSMAHICLQIKLVCHGIK